MTLLACSSDGFIFRSCSDKYLVDTIEGNPQSIEGGPCLWGAPVRSRVLSRECMVCQNNSEDVNLHTANPYA